jgi:mono/diheme cytochrome c family protein
MHTGSSSIRVATLVAAAIACAIQPLLAADAANGKRLAERWCQACHFIAAGQPQASADAPPFASIARRPDFDAAKIAFFLLDPHPKMPNMSLSRTEAADLAAYIGSLAR